jgi:Thioredoxin
VPLPSTSVSDLSDPSAAAHVAASKSDRAKLVAQAFELGSDYAQFVESLAPQSLGWTDFHRSVSVAGTDLAWRELRDLRVLAIVEDWCKDSRDSLPVLGALVRASPGSVLRIVSRDDHPDLMAAYLNDGFASIPVYVFMDEQLNELARYVERPRSVARLRRRDREQIAVDDPRFLPVEAKPSAFPEPLRSELRDLINARRLESLDQATALITSELGEIGERLLDMQEGDASMPPAGAKQTAGNGLNGIGPLQIVDVGDDDCEIPA